MEINAESFHFRLKRKLGINHSLVHDAICESDCESGGDSDSFFEDKNLTARFIVNAVPHFIPVLGRDLVQKVNNSAPQLHDLTNPTIRWLRSLSDSTISSDISSSRASEKMSSATSSSAMAVALASMIRVILCSSI